MLTRALLATLSCGAAAAAQSSLRVVCIAGQCLEGTSNTTIGTILSASGAQTDVLLLPGQYSESTNPQLLHDLLTSDSASLSPSSGFEDASSSFSLPLDLSLAPGISIYSEALYAGSSAFSQLPTTKSSSSTPINAKSLSLAPNTWAAVSPSGSSDDRIVLWEGVPDFSQLPVGNGSALTLLDMQSSACSPACSGAGICSASGTCTCPDGFTGSSCESCASGHFGKDCQACPAGCSKCDEGISGSGQCLEVEVANAPESCNCLNGQCGSNGQCSCNTGWTTSDNGTSCAKCSDGFFLSSTGDCQACQLGCTKCANNTGSCLTCKSGFTQDANDKTKCNAPQSTTPDGTICPDGSFSDGSKCQPCSPSCQTCIGATSNDCVLCKSGTYAFNGGCVSANQDGVCEGTKLIADNNKHECDTCGAKCTACKIPNFSVASTVDQLECSSCLPGSFLSDGKCIDSCPSGTFVDPKDNITCTKCSSSCGTCAGSADFCLTCSGGQLAVTSDGTCANSCPSGTFSSNSNACVSCHPDCATCSGNGFNQCESCPPDRPVLSNGRCLPTCSQKQYFASTTRQCQACDSSCSSCSGPGGDECLACDSDTQTLRGGKCQDAGCSNSTSVLPGLGVCLSELVIVPPPSGTGSASPQPSITGINDPTTVGSGGKAKLEWWQILLMALGCAFIFLAILWCWRRRARKQRAKQTRQFAVSKGLDRRNNWRWRLVRFGEKLFGHTASKRVYPEGLPSGPTPYYHDDRNEMMKMRNLREAEEARHDDEINDFIGAYARSEKTRDKDRFDVASRHTHDPRSSYFPPTMQSAPSLYSQVTGNPQKAPEPRVPVKRDWLTSRFSTSTASNSLGSSSHHSREHERREVSRRAESPAQAYANENRPRFLWDEPVLVPVDTQGHNTTGSNSHDNYNKGFLGDRDGAGAGVGGYWLEPNHTGSSKSKNPFRR